MGGGGVALLLVVCGVLILARSGRGTVKIEVDDPNVSVFIDDDETTTEGLRDPIALKVGDHMLIVKRGEDVVETRQFTINKGSNPPVMITSLDRNPSSSAAASNHTRLMPPNILPCVAPFSGEQAKQHQKDWADHLGVTIGLENSIGMHLALIPPGEFLMGAPQSDTLAEKHELPQHRVTILKPFYLGIHEVTLGNFGEFVQATGYKTEPERDGKGGQGFNKVTRRLETDKIIYSWKNPGWSQSVDHPVVNVTWNDAVEFCKWLSQKEGRTYRLPTEAEWEHACRSGSQTRWWMGDDISFLRSNIADIALRRAFPSWKDTVDSDDGYSFTAPVGRFEPNPFGLHDVHGNVVEWCSDWFDPNYYSHSPQVDPQGAAVSQRRVTRGGSWPFGTRHARATRRTPLPAGFRAHDVGFRIVLSLEE